MFIKLFKNKWVNISIIIKIVTEKYQFSNFIIEKQIIYYNEL